MRPPLEVADILRAHGAAFRRAHAGHLSLGQLKVMSAIEACRTAELGGHVARCDGCERLAVSFPLEVRFVRGDDGWLSPAQGTDTCQLGAYATDGPHRERYFAAFWEAMAVLDARPHWGKELSPAGHDIAARYPLPPRFLRLRDELDPDRLFDNAFLRLVLG